MTFRFLEDIAIADIAFEVEAPDLNSLFTEAAAAFLAVHIDNPENLQPLDSTSVVLVHADLDILLYLFLQELVYLKDVKGWLLKVDSVEVIESKGQFELRAELKGEVFDPARHQQRADVKAITMHSLEAKKTARGYRAQVVVDV